MVTTIHGLLLFFPQPLRQIQFDPSSSAPFQFGTFSEPGPEEMRYVIYLAQINWILFSTIYVFCEPVIGVLTFIWGQLGFMLMVWLKHMDEKE